MEVIKKSYALLSRRKRLELLGVFLSTVLMGLVSVAGVASIMPFMAVVANPAVVETNRWLSWGYTTFGFTSHRAFLSALGVLTLAVIAVSNGLSAFNAWMVARFQYGLNHELSCELLKTYLDQSYAFYLDRNSSKLAKNVLSEVSAVVNGVVAPLADLFAKLLVTLFLLALLLWVDVALALLVAALTASLYGGVYIAVRRRQTALGQQRLKSNTERYRAANEAFGGIKDVKVLGREATFLREFEGPSDRFARANASNTVVSQIPKFALETVAFGGILVIVLYLLRSYQDLGQVLPVVTLYAFAAYRLMPAFQVMFSSLTKARFNTAALDDLYADLVGERLSDEREGLLEEGEDAARAVSGGVRFERHIEVRGLTFTYPGAPAPALKSISMSIPRNSTVGLVGHTGAGKTTLADLLLGLYQPSGGDILVDGVPVTGDRLFSWRRRIGYVPQQIFLADNTIRRNIAFGIPEREIDDARMVRAARIAHLDEFVQTLPAAYDTVVGDRGVRLSGGQRQRVGIARALYDDPDVLIMDEATSALDNVTENAVMEAIHELSGRKTMVLVAHRLTTVQDCDRIFLLQDGRLAAAGTYDDLMGASESFRALVGAGARTRR